MTWNLERFVVIAVVVGLILAMFRVDADIRKLIIAALVIGFVLLLLRGGF